MKKQSFYILKHKVFEHHGRMIYRYAKIEMFRKSDGFWNHPDEVTKHDGIYTICHSQETADKMLEELNKEYKASMKE